MNISKKITALAVAGALSMGGLAVAGSAQAAEITPAGLITVTPTAGNVNTDVNFLDSIRVSVGAPVGFRALSGTFVYQGGVEVGSVSSARSTSMVSTAGTNGLDGNPVFMDRSIIPTNNFVSNRLLNNPALSTLTTGAFELRYYYFASATAPNRATDPYVKLDMNYNAATGAWAVGGAPAGPKATTTSLTASAAASVVTLTATVKDGASTAAAAAGTVVFKEGTTTVATVPVAAGVATAALAAVTDGPHVYTAEYTSSDLTAFLSSTSTSATVQVGGPAPASANITTTIAAGAGNGVLTLTGVTSTVALGTAVLTGTTLNASGTLNAVVTDSRQLDYPEWNLTGQVGDFTTSVGTPKTLSGKYLGWTPSVTGSPSAVAGAKVEPAPVSPNGLKTVSNLAKGTPNDVEITNVSALLQLKAPKNTPAGAYSATLTLTLI